MPKKPAPPPIQPEVDFSPPPQNQPVSPLATATGEYPRPLLPSAQECNATLYVQVLIEVVKTKQEQSYRECEYKLSLTNIHPSQGVWVARETNTSVHSSATNSDDSYWYSDLISPVNYGNINFAPPITQTDNSAARAWTEFAAVSNRPDCIYLLTSAEVEAISQPVEWACGP